ncbi:MAG: thiol:disulfide interchange protein DsbA [Oceanicoccus sp.]|jgi:thiol:disulfide interchange protein DsbA
MVANFIEIFWYGCRHCEKFEPLLQDWIKQLPAGSRFSRSPAIWSEPMMVHARAYYVANSLQLGHQFHMKLFTRILGLRASSDLAYHRRSIGQLFKVNGVGEAQFNELYDSDQVSKQVRFSRGLMKAAVINSTPSFLINGKYVLTATGFKSRQEMLALAKALLVSEMNSQPSDWW